MTDKPSSIRHDLQGLSSAGAAERLAHDGPNQLPGNTPKSTVAIVREVLTEPMFLMLLAADGIYLALGDRIAADAAREAAALCVAWLELLRFVMTRLAAPAGIHRHQRRQIT